MYIVKAEANHVEKIVDMSIRAFETDVNVGGAKGDCPPGFDSVEWHKQMAREGHLYLAMIENDLVGAAISFPDECKHVLDASPILTYKAWRVYNLTIYDHFADGLTR